MLSALHVHISSEMQAALEDLNCGFLTLERGLIQVKVSMLSPRPDHFADLARRRPSQCGRRGATAPADSSSSRSSDERFPCM